jgi:hypothetical protein
MPIDGSYGRLNAHKKRVEDFRRKKEFQKKKLDIFRLKSKHKLEFGTFDEKEIESTKKGIQQYSKKKLRIELILLISCVLIIALLSYILFK